MDERQYQLFRMRESFAAVHCVVISGLCESFTSTLHHCYPSFVRHTYSLSVPQMNGRVGRAWSDSSKNQLTLLRSRRAMLMFMLDSL